MGTIMNRVLLGAAFASVLLAAACADVNKKTTAPATAPGLTGASPAGAGACVFCHAPATADWLASRHGNLSAAGELDDAGLPAMAQLAGCTVNCHDPNGDGGRLTAGTTGNVPRPVVGCEACHGPGSAHLVAAVGGSISLLSAGAGTIIGSTPVSGQFATCTACHELLNSAGTGTALAVHAPASAVTPTGDSRVVTDTHFAQPGSWRTADGLTTHNTVSDATAVAGYAMVFSDERVCTNCHAPHGAAAINREWALSGHADRQGIGRDPKTHALAGTGFFSGAWAHYNWSCDGTSSAGCGPSTGTPNDRRACQRCHTTTGFAAYADALAAGNTALTQELRTGASARLAYASEFKPETLQCGGCHLDYRGRLRNPGPVTAVYELVSDGVVYAQASHAYPDLAGSNVCMACHTGRESGDTIKNLNRPGMPAVDFSNRSFVNSHYLAAGGFVFAATGYTFGGRNYGNLAAYRHDAIGSPSAPGTGANGPCIGCHMSRPGRNGSHLFLPVTRVRSGETTSVTGVASEVCAACHGPNESGLLAVVQEERTRFADALEALKTLLETRGYYFADAHPYFFKLRARTGQAVVTQGSAVVTGSGVDWIASGVTGTDAEGEIADRIRIDADGRYHAVKSVDSPTQLTLQAPYAGASSPGGAAYTIVGDRVRNWLTAPDGDTTGAASGKHNMGAAFNFNLLAHDPGAYAHNRMYAGRLIYDSLDWLDDNELNYSAGATLAAACSSGSAPAWCVGAMRYLLPNGALGIEAERP